MGCAGSLLPSYTVEETETELAALTPHLPVAILMNDGIIKLEGANGFFNPDSLLDPLWLNGKMTPEEYYDAITYINICAAYTQVGLSKIHLASELPNRAELRTQAGMSAVQHINEQNSSVRFTYQQTTEIIQLEMSYSTEPMLRLLHAGASSVGNATKSILYINVNL